MNKKFTKLLAALALLVFMTPSLAAWGQTTYSLTIETSDFNTTSYAANNGAHTKNAVDVNNPSNTLEIGWYSNQVMQQSNVMQWQKNTGYIYNTTSLGTINSVTVNSSAGTFTTYYGDTQAPSSSTTVGGGFFQTKVGNATGKTTSIVISFTIAGGTTPTCAIPTFSPAAGTYTSAQDVTISTTTDGATIYYTLDGNDPTTSSSVYSTPINITETTTVKAMAVAEDYNNSAVATAAYTITTPSTIAEVRAQGTGSVFTQGVVTSCVGTTGYIQDATAAICVYGNSLTIGDEITVSGTLSDYNGLLEITNPTITVVSNGNTVNPELMTIAQVNASTNQGWFVRIEDAKVTDISGQNTTIAQGDNTIVVRGISGVEYSVNDVLSLNGNIGYYNANQIANPQNVEVQQSLEPTITVTPSTVDAPFTGADGTLTISYENIPDLISFDIQFCDANGNELEGDDPDWIDTEIQEENDVYSVYYVIDANDGAARTAYFKVYTFVGEELEEVYSIVTVNQAQYVVDYATLPFEWAGGASADFLALNGVTASGLGSDYSSTNAPYLIKLDGTGDYIQVKCDQQPGIVTIGVKMIGGATTSTITVQGSADGETFTNIQVLTISGSQNDILTLTTTNAFAVADRYVRLLFTKGSNVGVGPISIAVVSNEPSITVTPDQVNVEATSDDEDYIEGTLAITYENLTINDMSDFDIQYYDADGEEISSSDEPLWIEVLVAEQDPSVGEGYVVSYIVDENEGDARTAYFKVFALGDNDYVYSNLVTITQEAYVAPFEPVTYTLATSIESGRHYIIAASTATVDKAIGVGNSNYRTAVDISINDNVASVTSNDVYEFVINGPDSDGYYTIYDQTTPGFLAGGNKALPTQTSSSRWSIEISSGIATIASVDQSGFSLQYNASSPRFACYSSSQTAVSLYVKDNETNYTYVKDIAGYGSASSSTNWYLISSPAQSVLPGEVTNLIEPNNHYDLYRFNQSAVGSEWENYKNADHADDFDLSMGVGYLYANANNVTLIFTGERYQNADYYAPLEYDADANLPGMTLVGNPYGHAANVDRTEFYVMNEEGSEIIAGTSNVVEAMQGIFVEAAETDQYVTFTPANGVIYPEGDDKFVLNLTQNRGNVIDRAIVRFGEGRQLPKFQINKNNTKLYIPQDNQDYAVVRSEGQGELPVNFRAAKNGTYTLSIDTESMDVNYLHLIDNMTGMDIDLLQTPSYTFEATTRDYESRFKLVFAGASASAAADEAFAFFSNGSLIVSNEGEATLQVVDLTGRILSSESISGSCSTRINATAGVYMLRLINGDNVKVQKIVVR